MTKKNKISACIIVYNDEALINKCLENIKDVVDEIIVVHDGKCSDKTLEIASRYNAIIFEKLPHIGEAEPYRQFSFDKATGDWIFQIDPDERLSPGLKVRIKELIKDKNVDAYAFKWDFYHFKGRSRYQYKPCLFRKSAMLPFSGIPHDSVKVKGKTIKSKLILEHHSPESIYTIPAFKKKGLRYIRIQAKYLKKDKPAIYYLIKSIVYFFIYLTIDTIKYYNFRIGAYSGVYNFLVWYNVYKIKKIGNK